ncbi:MAG: alkaline phosphatase family protein [Flavobacterium sp.]|nr:MAG: alkaline phosphatase family protein [Flavobacterium sp.]
MKINSNGFGRFAVVFSIIKSFLLISTVLRIVLLIWQFNDVSLSLPDLLRTLLTGFVFDIGTAAFITFLPVLYFTVLPNKLIGTVFDKVVIWFFTSLALFILMFTFLAEITFWDEFHTRFNFIAVDYLIYTHEVVDNIRQSYPLPVLIGTVLLCTFLVVFISVRRGNFKRAFSTKADFTTRMLIFIPSVLVVAYFGFFVSNNDAEWSSNRYNSEISKSGIYSFFAAFRNNRMDYSEFYTTINNEKAFSIVRGKLAQQNSRFAADGLSIHRTIVSPAASEAHPNVVFILVESLSGSFLKEFGNKDNITPFMDSLAQKSVFFENLYATGTRTVRGMEAVTLSIPPTPGQSIVKRPNNENLYTVASVFNKRNYECNFFYGGDGYFDNMNDYFGGNGFNIYDRGRGSVLSDNIKTTRNNIDDSEVTFENAWGVCDEDIYRKMMKVADDRFAKNQPFFNFIMTVSNHRPYTYPEGKIDLPSGKSRNGAVKYTDFALRDFFRKAKRRPWFKNTVFVIIADHCASSAGKDEIDIKNYHIPAFIINLPDAQPMKIVKQCSQIDLFPTLFSLLHWSYDSNFFGKDVLSDTFEERALSGTYRKLALIKGEKVVILSDQKKQAFYRYSAKDDDLKPIAADQNFLEEAIAWYQTADYLFTNKLLK